jgi:hypothetical protein
MTEIPIFDMILRRPASMASRYRRMASVSVPSTNPFSIRSAMESSAR